MHSNEITTDVPLVRRLLNAQFPEWARLSIEPVRSAGTDNAIYRLGERLAVRMPRIDWATAQVEKEQRWLPRLAPHLPLAIPVPIAMGTPDEGYPCNWSVCPWLEGENATIDRLADPKLAAKQLGEFITALRAIDPTGGPVAGEHNFSRGVPLVQRDDATRAAIGALRGTLDTSAITTAWEAALAVPAYSGAPAWIHGDLQSGNLLAVGGELAAVIDFGGLGVGDPACDLMPAWNLFARDAREVFRANLSIDDATWSRGRGWALSASLIALPYYRDTNPTLAGIARYAIHEVLEDHVRERGRGS